MKLFSATTFFFAVISLSSPTETSAVVEALDYVKGVATTAGNAAVNAGSAVLASIGLKDNNETDVDVDVMEGMDDTGTDSVVEATAAAADSSGAAALAAATIVTSLVASGAAISAVVSF